MRNILYNILALSLKSTFNQCFKNFLLFCLQYDEAEKRREMAKNSLERYTHYYERWATNQSVCTNVSKLEQYWHDSYHFVCNSQFLKWLAARILEILFSEYVALHAMVIYCLNACNCEKEQILSWWS